MTLYDHTRRVHEVCTTLYLCTSARLHGGNERRRRGAEPPPSFACRTGVDNEVHRKVKTGGFQVPGPVPHVTYGQLDNSEPTAARSCN